MKYLKADEIFPEHVLNTIQEFIDGVYVYIPRKNGEKRLWGEKSGTRESLKKRNSEIYKKYENGIKVPELSRIYYLSEQSIRRIIRQEKAFCTDS